MDLSEHYDSVETFLFGGYRMDPGRRGYSTDDWLTSGDQEVACLSQIASLGDPGDAIIHRPRLKWPS